MLIELPKMKHRLLLILGWLLATAALYVTLVALELYWNLFTWRPQGDLRAAGMLVAIAGFLAAIHFLARTGSDSLTRFVSLAACLALLAIGAYVLPPEPITTGLFARAEPSPFWYRAGRLVLFALPTLFWCLALRRPR